MIERKYFKDKMRTVPTMLRMIEVEIIAGRIQFNHRVIYVHSEVQDIGRMLEQIQGVNM